jgi:hypothetical protein
MLEHEVLQAFVLLVASITNHLYLRLVGNGLEIWMKNGTLGIKSLPVAIAALTSWIKSFGDFVLSCPSYQYC